MTEKLTEEDRALLAHESPVLGPEAIRLIDAQASELDHERRLTSDQYQTIRAQQTQSEAMQTRLAEARAENERLNRALLAEEQETESLCKRLGEARALLVKYDFAYGLMPPMLALKKVLTANPESPGAAAERAVLDACARLAGEVMRIFASANPEEGYGSPFKCMAASVFRAELARRAVKP